MPRAPKKCANPGCETRVIARTYCDEHKPTNWHTSTRPPSTRASRDLRARVLERDPFCTCTGCPRCSRAGCVRPSTEDDHLRNLAAGGTDDISNHRGLCSPCHGYKTQREASEGRARRRFQHGG